METFLAHAKRVLRHDGYLLYADFRNKNDVEVLHRQMEKSGMKILKREDITPNVVRSLDLDNQRKLLLIRALFQTWLLKPFQEFAGVKGSKIYARFQSGTMIYLPMFCRNDWQSELSLFSSFRMRKATGIR